MNHRDLNEAMLRAYLDGQLDPAQTSTVEEHLKSCTSCQDEIAILRSNATRVRDGFEQLPDLTGADDTATAWAAFEKKREDWMNREQNRWPLWQRLSLAGGGLGIAAVVLLLTGAPVRGWAESLLAIFRVEHFTVLELNPATLKGAGLENNQMLNRTISRAFSDEITVTQSPQRPRLVADAATASKLAGFSLHLLPGEAPASLLLESGVGIQMKLDRDRIQSILDEAGHSDLQIPESVDGATIRVRVPAGVMAFYGNCGDVASRMVGQGSPAASTKSGSQPGASGDRPSQQAAAGDDSSSQEADSTCIWLDELPSPVVSMPQEIDPGQIAQVALQFLGMNANDAANFTQTVDWTSTLVLPVFRGESKYEQVPVNGDEGALLRSAHSNQSGFFTLMWVDNGIVFALKGTGDDTTAIGLASQLQ